MPCTIDQPAMTAAAASSTAPTISHPIDTAVQHSEGLGACGDQVGPALVEYLRHEHHRERTTMSQRPSHIRDTDLDERTGGLGCGTQFTSQTAVALDGERIEHPLSRPEVVTERRVADLQVSGDGAKAETGHAVTFDDGCRGTEHRVAEVAVVVGHVENLPPEKFTDMG